MIMEVIGDGFTIDLPTLIGSGGLGVGGWLAASLSQYLRRMSSINDLAEKYMVAKLEYIADCKRYHEEGREHWRKEEGHLRLIARAVIKEGGGDLDKLRNAIDC